MLLESFCRLLKKQSHLFATEEICSRIFSGENDNDNNDDDVLETIHSFRIHKKIEVSFFESLLFFGNIIIFSSSCNCNVHGFEIPKIMNE